MIKNRDLERKVLSGLLQHPSVWPDISHLINENDFDNESKVHGSLFKLLRAGLNNNEVIDDTVLIGRINNLKMSFADDIDIAEYIQNLKFFKITKENFLGSLRELKKITFKRSTVAMANKIGQWGEKVDTSLPYSQLLNDLDSMFHDSIDKFESGDSGSTINLSQTIRETVIERSKNPLEHVGLMSPYETVNKTFGSIVRVGNITCFAARAKVGKSSIALDMALKISYENNVAVLHFDNGEMSHEELMWRMASSISGIPVSLIESGRWINATVGTFQPEEVRQKVNDALDWIEKTTILYENVAGLTGEEKAALLKRVYYSKVGRGEQLVFSYDYLKTDFKNLGKGADWAFIGKELDLYKQVITKDVLFDKKQMIAMITSVQCNRLGITNNRDSENIIEDESVVGLSDNIIQFCSHIFLLRKKTLDEIMEEGTAWGTHKLVCFAARHLGVECNRFLNPVVMPDGSQRNNFINLEFKNFMVVDKGDLVDMVSAMNNNDIAVVTNSNNGNLPDGL